MRPNARKFLAVLCFALPVFCADCRAQKAVVTDADVKVESKPGGLDKFLRDSFISYLGALKDNPPAAEIRAYLLAHPGLEFRVVPGMLGAGVNRYWALFDSKHFQIRVSNDFVTGTGYTSSGVGMSPEEFDKFIEAAAPLLVHETMHAEILSELGVDTPGALEDELLADAYESWFLKAAPAPDKPENFSLGAGLYDQLLPLATAYAAASGKASPARRIELVDGMQHKVDAIRGGPDKLNPLSANYSTWVAYTKGWVGFSDYAHLFHLTKGPVLAPPAQIKLYVRYLKKLQAEAGREHGKEADRIFSNLMSFWESPRKIAMAQAYYGKKMKVVAAHAGQ